VAIRSAQSLKLRARNPCSDIIVRARSKNEKITHFLLNPGNYRANRRFCGLHVKHESNGNASKSICERFDCEDQ